MSNYLLLKSFLALDWGLKKKIPQLSELMKFLIPLRNKLLYVGSSEAGLRALAVGEGRQQVEMLCCPLFWAMPGTEIAAVFLRGAKACPEPGFMS